MTEEDVIFQEVADALEKEEKKKDVHCRHRHRS